MTETIRLKGAFFNNMLAFENPKDYVQIVNKYGVYTFAHTGLIDKYGYRIYRFSTRIPLSMNRTCVQDTLPRMWTPALWEMLERSDIACKSNENAVGIPVANGIS